MEKSCQLLPSVFNINVSFQKNASKTEKLFEKMRKYFEEKKFHSVKSTKLEVCWGVTMVLFCWRLWEFNRVSCSWSAWTIPTAYKSVSSDALFGSENRPITGFNVELLDINLFRTLKKKLMSKSVLRLWDAISRRLFFLLCFFPQNGQSS